MDRPPAESGPAPLFSVLLPSRDRLELLKHAVASTLGQDFADFEIVVSDNASSDDYAGFVASLGDARVRYLRSDAPLVVTDNWSRALDAARGRYVIMLGDDDALCPGYLSRLARLIEQFGAPDVVYSMAYHYAYPGVFPNAPNGFLAEVKPRPIFRDDATAPYRLDVAEARRFGRQALRFRHLFGFNSQFFAWSRAFIERLGSFGPFFQSPYPDFYAAFMTMLHAETIGVDPDPGVIIGISPRSFGFYFHNHQLDAGNRMLLLSPRDAEAVSAVSAAAKAALDLPGSSHYRNWLVAALVVLGKHPPDPALWVDYRRYRRIQLFETAYQRSYRQAGPAALAKQLRANLDAREQRLFDRLSWTFASLRRSRAFAEQAVHDGLFALYRIYPDAFVKPCALEGHAHVMDAWNWIAAQRQPGAEPETGERGRAAPPDTGRRRSARAVLRSWTRQLVRAASSEPRSGRR